MISNLIRPIWALCLLGLSAPALSQLQVLACEPEWQALVEVLAGDKAQVSSATNAFVDPHHIEARPSLIVKARKADLVVCTGAELEVGWLPLLISRSTNGAIQAGQPGHFLAADQVSLIEQHQHVDRSMGDVHGAGNPHIHWDPYRLLEVARQLSQRLVQLDGKHQEHYQVRLQAFEHLWQHRVRQWQQQAAPLKGKKVIVYHKNWSYLLSWLGVEAVADLEPKPGIGPTSAHLAKLLQLTEQQPIDAILIANYQDKKGADWLSQKSGIEVLELPFTVGGDDDIQDLFSLYDAMIKQLLAGMVD